MAKNSGPLLLTIVLSCCALTLTIEELLRPQTRYPSMLQAPHVGTLILLALIGATTWLVRSTPESPRATAWAKAALTFAVALPLIWLFHQYSFVRELARLPDADLPQGWAARMNGDLLQTQIVALAVTIGLMACAIASWSNRS